MSDNDQTYMRWYDKQPKLSQAVKMIILLPDDIISVLSEGVMRIADRDFQVRERMHSIRTLGTEKVLGLYKSKNKRREYDQNELLHQTMNHLYILSDHHRALVSTHVLNLVQYGQMYLGTCRTFKQEPKIDEVSEMTDRYVEKGPEETEAFLRDLREHYQQLLNGTRKTILPFETKPIGGTDTIQSSNDGMKIRRSL